MDLMIDLLVAGSKNSFGIGRDLIMESFDGDSFIFAIGTVFVGGWKK